jgi:hypothetical protein
VWPSAFDQTTLVASFPGALPLMTSFRYVLLVPVLPAKFFCDKPLALSKYFKAALKYAVGVVIKRVIQLFLNGVNPRNQVFPFKVHLFLAKDQGNLYFEIHEIKNSKTTR